MKAGPYTKRGFLGAAALIAADQLSKWWVLKGLKLPEVGSIEFLPFLNFTMVWNRGISMGIPLGESLGKWGIVALTFGISAWIAHMLLSTNRQFEGWGYSLILGGALGNIIDRFVHGAVVDFVHLHAAGYSFYVFNLADSAITIGVALLLIDGLRASGKGPKNAKKVGDSSADQQGES